MRTYTTWQCPLPSGGKSDEISLCFDGGRVQRVLVLPALFEEANKMRRLAVEVMHRLNLSGIDTILPDLPGCNESLAQLEEQTLAGWRKAAKHAAAHFRATHIFSIRAGALIAPDHLLGWQYAPLSGAKQLRILLRARTIAAREAGRKETIDGLLEIGRKDGLELGGWHLGAKMIRDLERAVPTVDTAQTIIDHPAIGGAGLWLRAEPDDDPEQADALAAIITIGMGGS